MPVVADPRWTPKRIRELRKAKGMTQADFADALGYDRVRSVGDLEHGRMEPSGSVCRVLDYIDTFGFLPDRPGDDA